MIYAVLFWQERRPILRESRAPMNKRAPVTSFTICVSATAIGWSRSILLEKKCCRRYEGNGRGNRPVVPMYDCAMTPRPQSDGSTLVIPNECTGSEKDFSLRSK